MKDFWLSDSEPILQVYQGESRRQAKKGKEHAVLASGTGGSGGPKNFGSLPAPEAVPPVRQGGKTGRPRLFFAFRQAISRGLERREIRLNIKKTAPVQKEPGLFAGVEGYTERLLAGVLNRGLGPCYRNIATEMGTFRGAIMS